MGKAATRAQNRYIAKAYDRVNLVLPKGRKDELQKLASDHGESLNSFINKAIEEHAARMREEEEKGGA